MLLLRSCTGVAVLRCGRTGYELCGAAESLAYPFPNVAIYNRFKLTEG